MIKNYFKKLIFPFLFTIFFVVSCSILLAQSSVSKIDQYSYKLSNYHKTNHYSDYNSSILRINKLGFSEEESSRNFYDKIEFDIGYSKYVKDYRRLIVNETNVFNEPLKILNNKTYSITEKDDEIKYYVDGNKLSTYFPSSLLPERDMIKARFGCDSFIFLSDTFADKLLAKYNLTNYEDLILDENYCVLPVMENGELLFTVSINNIIKSEELSGKRIKNLYGDFGFSYFSDAYIYKTKFNLAFEVDIKVDPFGTSKVLNYMLFSKEYNPNQCEYNIIQFDVKSGKYVTDSSFSEEIKSISQDNDLLIFILSICIVFSYSVLFVIFYDKILKNDKEIKLYFLSYLVAYSIFAFVISFFYFNWLMSIFPTFILILYLFTFSKTIGKIINRFTKKEETNND